MISTAQDSLKRFMKREIKQSYHSYVGGDAGVINNL